MKIKAFLNLIRWKNLLLLAYTLILIEYVLFKHYNFNSNLSYFQFFALLLSIVLITAAGYIFNDIIDIACDTINKPKKITITNQFSIETAKRLYLTLNTFGIAIGLALSLNLQKPGYAFIFIGASLLLYIYSKKLKQKVIIGNIAVSFLTAFSIAILLFFTTNFTVKINSQKTVITIVLVLATFSFWLNFIREIIKDIEDVNGDYALKMQTLPIVLGTQRTKKITSFICLIPIVLLTLIFLYFFDSFKFTLLYLLIFALLPLMYVALKLQHAKHKKDFKRLSILLKIIMFLGINSVLILTFLD